MADGRSPLLSLSTQQLADRIGAGSAKAVYRLIAEGGDPFEAGRLTPGAARRLHEHCVPTDLHVEHVSVASDRTTKMLLRLADRRAVEMVAIPTDDRTTLCVSSQVGCARGCDFCLTATMGLVRNMSCDEIVAQVQQGIRIAREHDLPGVQNVVYMGMGEPLDNLENVARSVDILTDHIGFGIAPRKVTVSTVGTHRSAILTAAKLPSRLAWSLHAADDEVRTRLIPTAKASVFDLRQWFEEALDARPLFVEIVLIDGVNDHADAADAVIRLFEGFRSEVRVNLLPLNSIARDDLRPSPGFIVEAFRDHLRAAGMFCMVRRSRGEDRNAACGQLAVVG